MGALKASIVLIMTGAFYLALAGLANEPRVQIHVESGFQFEPAYVKLKVRVIPHKENRGLTVALVSEGYERSSLEELSGDQAPITRWIEYRDIPSGEYAVIAILQRPPERPILARDRLTVLSRF